MRSTRSCDSLETTPSAIICGAFGYSNSPEQSSRKSSQEGLVETSAPRIWSCPSGSTERITMKDKPPRQTVTFEQLTYSNMLTLNALVELLTEKGVLSKPEILERIRKVHTPRLIASVLAILMAA